MKADTNVAVSIANRKLADAVSRAIATAVRMATPLVTETPPVVRLRTMRKLALLGPETIEGAIVVVRVHSSGARRLPKLVAAIREMNPAGVQIVWDGAEPPREEVERHVFTALEYARATPAGPPVVLSKERTPEFSLRVLIAHRKPTEGDRTS